jgi:hypothetical protein
MSRSYRNLGGHVAIAVGGVDFRQSPSPALASEPRQAP